MNTEEYLRSQCDYVEKKRDGVYMCNVDNEWHLVCAGTHDEANLALNALYNAKYGNPPGFTFVPDEGPDEL